MENLTFDKNGERLYIKWAGEDFKGKIIPFGARVEYLVPKSRPDE